MTLGIPIIKTTIDTITYVLTNTAKVKQGAPLRKRGRSLSEGNKNKRHLKRVAVAAEEQRSRGSPASPARRGSATKPAPVAREEVFPSRPIERSFVIDGRARARRFVDRSARAPIASAIGPAAVPAPARPRPGHRPHRSSPMHAAAAHRRWRRSCLA